MRCDDGAEKRRNSLSLALGSPDAESSGRVPLWIATSGVELREEAGKDTRGG
jgi:hypothetical protein